MGKVLRQPSTALCPVPAVMVSCGKEGVRPNIITIAWAGTVCSDPPMLSVSVRPSRHSYSLIKDSGEFVVNVPSSKLARATDWCGVNSGRDYDKFQECNLTASPAAKLKHAPLIEEAPLNIECKVREVLSLGAHDMFVGEIAAVHMDDELLDENGKLDPGKTDFLAAVQGRYWTLGEMIGRFGFSLRS